VADRRLVTAQRNYGKYPTQENAARLIRELLRSGNVPGAREIQGQLGGVDGHEPLILPGSFFTRNSAGTCGLCEVPFERGEEAFYLTALRNEEDGLRTGRQLPRGASSVRKRPAECSCTLGPRGKPPQRHRENCELAGRYFRWDYQTLPGVWEHMVHLPCAISAGYQVPGGSVEAVPGTRTVGHANKGPDENPNLV
jgi:hypothetical protein